MKTNKLKLENLEVKSFVTNLKEKGLQTVQGGATAGVCQSEGTCRTYVEECFANIRTKEIN
jgi:hypothetical protein